MGKITQYFSDTIAELKQVSWPTQHQAMLYTVLVIAISAVVSMFVGLFDFAFGEVVKLVVDKF